MRETFEVVFEDGAFREKHDEEDTMLKRPEITNLTIGLRKIKVIGNKYEQRRSN